jgi:hypothetical protein
VSLLNAISQAWVTAEASLPFGWELAGLMRFGDAWITFSTGPAADDHLGASDTYAHEALNRLAGALRELRKPRPGTMDSGHVLTRRLDLSWGQLIDVGGRLETSQWDDDSGVGQWKTEIVLASLERCRGPATTPSGSDNPTNKSESA